MCISEKKVTSGTNRKTLIEDQETHSFTLETEFHFSRDLKGAGESRAQCFHFLRSFLAL